MPTFRVERTGNYTVMSNHHLRNEKLSLLNKIFHGGHTII